MLGHLYLTFGLAVFTAVILWEAPLLPVRKVVRSRIIKAKRASVWRKLLERPEHRFVGDEPVPGSPDNRRIEIDTSNGYRESRDIVTYEPIETARNERLSRRIVAQHDVDFKPGMGIDETWILEDHPEGTRVTLSHERNVLQSLSALLATRREIYSTLDWFQSFCEGTSSPRVVKSEASSLAPSPATLRRNLVNVALFLLTVGAAAFLFSWNLALFMVSVLIVHELGHWIGFKVAGHSRPRIVILPLIGGAVVSDRPFRSAREEAFVSLMGPGLSALYGIAFMLVAYDLGADFSDIFGVNPGPEYARKHYADIMCVAAAALIGIANIFQMIPVPPLDGGHVWRALLHSDRHRFIRYVFPVAAILVTWLAFSTGNVMFGVLVALVCLIWPAAISTRLSLPVMSAGEKTVVGTAYVAIAVVHLVPIYVLMRPFM